MLGELERCVKDLGFIATYASPDPGGRRTTPGMHEAYWHPLYAKCQEWGIPIIVHGTNALDRRFRVVPHNYQLGFYTEQYLATQFLGHGDVFQRFPELKRRRLPLRRRPRSLPQDRPASAAEGPVEESVLRHLRVRDSIFLEAAIKQRGVDRIVFGTEAPGSGRHVIPETGRSGDDLVPVIDSFGFLSEADKIRS